MTPHRGRVVLGVIPARMGSTRLPGKPLRLVGGRPLVEWVWRRMSRIGVIDALIVATDDVKIVREVERLGGRAVLTRVDHASGTDRVAEVAGLEEYAHFECVLNLQGDELFLPSGAAEAVVDLLEAGWDIGTAAVPIERPEEFEDPSTVKVVLDDQGGALYFSRSAIPHAAASGQAGKRKDPLGLRHVGLYGFTRAALQRATSLPRHPLELREKLEQLRWLAGGLEIGVAVLEGGSPGVDTESDLLRADELLRGRKNSP